MLRGLKQWWLSRQAARLEIPSQLWQEVEQHLPFLDRLGPESRLQLRDLARQFIADKEWTGAQNLTLTPQIQLAIALQACLPVLKLGLDWYSDWVGVIVYPGDFVIPRRVMDEDGVVHEYDDDVVGEAWEGGPVLISWFDRAEDHGGINIVIHEFAHKLDMRKGTADGMPSLHSGMSTTRWIATMSAAYEHFCRRIDAGEGTAIDPYAAEHPAEFFAVLSEVFFETPELLHEEYPDVYQEFSDFYRQDPRHPVD